MRIVVTGARGYIGSRLVPVLLERGHEVVATASSEPVAPAYDWARQVTWVQMDATHPGQVRAALAGADAVCYLVHSLDRRGFAGRDRLAAEVVREAVDETGVRRVVYLSGLVPDLPEDRLSAHIASRLEVERILSASRASVASLRAGVVLGAGSTSFEIIRQLAGSMLVQPVPRWLTSRVQPIGVGDVVALLAQALESTEPAGPVDIGGPDVVAYPELLGLVAREARLLRFRLPVPPVPTGAVAFTAPLFTAAPPHTVAALVRSLRHDMVCDESRRWRLPGGETPLREAVRAALAERDDPGLSAYRSAAGDPTWTSGRLLAERVTGLRLPLPAVVRYTAHAAEQRAGRALSRLRG